MSFESKYKAAKETIVKLHKKAREVGSGTKPLLMAGGAGAAGQYLTDFAADKVDFVKDNWYGNGAVLTAAAMLARKKSRVAALGLAGAAGYALAFDKKLDDFQANKSKTSPVRLFKRTEAPAGGGGGGGNSTGADDDASSVFEPAA